MNIFLPQDDKIGFMGVEGLKRGQEKEREKEKELIQNEHMVFI